MERIDKVVHDTGLAKDQKEKIRDNTQADLQTTQSAMDAASKYSDTLKPICVQVQVTFEDRDRLRKEEIEAPQEAHSLLDQPKNVSWKQRNEELTSDMENSFCKMQTVKPARCHKRETQWKVI